MTDPCVSVVVPSSKVTKRLCRFVPFAAVSIGGCPPAAELLFEEIGIESLLEATKNSNLVGDVTFCLFF